MRLCRYIRAYLYRHGITVYRSAHTHTHMRQVRTVAIAAGRKLKVEHYDVKNAFTQSNIDAESLYESIENLRKASYNLESAIMECGWP